MASESPRSKRKRRNYAQERVKIVTHCQACISAMTFMCKQLPAEMAERMKAQIEAYEDVLTQMGEKDRLLPGA